MVRVGKRPFNLIVTARGLCEQEDGHEDPDDLFPLAVGYQREGYGDLDEGVPGAEQEELPPVLRLVQFTTDEEGQGPL
ncbi:MAG: hypothetical protein ACREX4_20060 [Gammaproteobacteria bacterium]